MTAATAMRVLVIDDHPVVREGLRSILTCDGIAMVGDAGTGAEGLRLAWERRPDVVLLDMQLPDMLGVEVLRELKRSTPDVAVLVLSMHDDPGLIRRAMEAGAAGYVLKGIKRADLLATMRAACGRPASVDATRSTGGALTTIERRMLGLMAAGRTNGEIGEQMRWSVATTKRYLQRIFEKLEATDRTQAVASAFRRGLID